MRNPKTTGPNPTSTTMLTKAVARSKRSSGPPFPPEFVQSEDPEVVPPMARMLRGGRGGEVRLKLYLTLNLIAAAAPYDIDPSPARAWAEMMSLPDPERTGARRVSSALNWLDQNRFVELTRLSGSPPRITLLTPAGTGAAHSQRLGGRWVNVPTSYWSESWITLLSGAATALLVVLLHAQGGRQKSDPPWFTTERKRRYGLSDDTWTRATKELASWELLEVGRVSQGRSEFDWQRMRNTYWLDLDKLEAGPSPAGPRPPSLAK